MTGNKTITSSFNVPYQKGSKWTTLFDSIINGTNLSSTAEVVINFSSAVFTLYNVEFNSLDFADVNEEIVEYPISITAYEDPITKSLGKCVLTPPSP